MARTRSASAHAKVLQAASELFAARGIEGTSMDAIAESSAVSKATIYKHWADKDALLLEVLEEVNGLKDRPTFSTNNTRQDVVDVLAYRPTENAELRSRIMPHFMGYAARHTEFGDMWRSRVTEPPRRELTRLLSKAMEEGELERFDIEVALAQLLGPMVYWYLFLRRSQENPRMLAEAVVDLFWRAAGRGK